jgi:adenosylcobinamide-phosphate synthase
MIRAMSFFAIAFALLWEQVHPLHWGSGVHRMALAWMRGCARSLDAGRLHHGWLVWLTMALLPAALAAILALLLSHLWGWVGHVLAFLWHVAVLYVTLGFRQFSHHFTAIRDALEDGQTAQAQRLLAQWMQVDEASMEPQHMLRILMRHSVVAAHRHVLGVLGWYSLLAALGLGPAGAVLYRMSEWAARDGHFRSLDEPDSTHVGSPEPRALPAQPRLALPIFSSTSTQRVLQAAWWWIDYVPARITAIGFAVVGSFEDVMGAWRQHVANNQASTTHDRLIQETMLAALGAPANLAVEHLRSMVGIVWRSVVLWLLLIGLLSLARLSG